MAHFLRLFSLTFLVFFFSIHADTISMSAPVQIGSGSNFQWIATGSDGNIHVCYNGKYRSGATIAALNPEETITSDDGNNFANPKLTVDPNGIPHIVYQKGCYGSAASCFYTKRLNGSWITPERFALKTEVSSTCERTTLPDVAADAAGNVLTCFWPVHNESSLGLAAYRWRDPSGTWGLYKGNLSTYHAATPKVAQHDGKFYLHYARNSHNPYTDLKMLAGPIDPLADIAQTQTHFDSWSINRSYQNEGVNFTIASNGDIAAAGNFRKTTSGGGVGIWASHNLAGSFSATIISEWSTYSNSGAEGSQQPNLVFDEATGDLYVVYFFGADKKTYYNVLRGGTWTERKRLLPEYNGTQGYFRNGPSIADIPGPGVIVSVVNDNTVYLRTLGADEATAVTGSNPGLLPWGPTGVHRAPSGMHRIVVSGTGAHEYQVFSMKGSIVASGRGHGSRTYPLDAFALPVGKYVARIVTSIGTVGSVFMVSDRN